MAEFTTGHAGPIIGDDGGGRNPEAEEPRQNDFRHRRHADDIGADGPKDAVFGSRLKVRPGDGDVDAAVGDEILDKITNSDFNMVALAWMDGGTRNLYTKKPVRSPADLKGQKVRMMGNPLFVDTMNAMGGNGISMGYGEVFTALQTGVVDGAENNAPSFFTSNHYSTGAKFYTQTNHLIIPELLVVSKVTWDKLSKDDQALLKKVGREAQLEQRALWDKSVEDYTAKLKAAGVEFINVDTKAFYDATAPVRAKYGANYADLMKRIEAVK